jgi:hypothetical protein
MADRRWAVRTREPVDRTEPLDVNREARIRQLHEELTSENGLAAAGARATIGDLLAEVSRLRRLAIAGGLDPDGQ